MNATSKETAKEILDDMKAMIRRGASEDVIIEHLRNALLDARFEGWVKGKKTEKKRLSSIKNLLKDS